MVEKRVWYILTMHLRRYDTSPINAENSSTFAFCKEGQNPCSVKSENHVSKGSGWHHVRMRSPSNKPTGNPSHINPIYLEALNPFVEPKVGVFSEEVLRERIVKISLNKTSVSSLACRSKNSERMRTRSLEKRTISCRNRH